MRADGHCLGIANATHHFLLSPSSSGKIKNFLLIVCKLLSYRIPKNSKMEQSRLIMVIMSIPSNTWKLIVEFEYTWSLRLR